MSVMMFAGIAHGTILISGVITHFLNRGVTKE